MTDRNINDVKWALGIADTIANDPRSYVKVRETYPVYNLKQMINHSGKVYADNIAFMQKWRAKGEYESITYKEVLADVNALGTALNKLITNTKRVAIIGPNCYQWCSSYLAVAGGIGCVVPLDKELNDEELKNQIIRSDAECVIFDKKHLDTFTKMKESGDTLLTTLINFDAEEAVDGVLSWRQLINEGREMLEAGDEEYLNAEVDSEAMSVLIFTSGTTGVPKGVMINQRNLCAELMIAPAIFKVDEEDRFFSFLPLHHTYECTCGFLIPLYKGASVAFCQGLKYITKNLAESEPTLMLGVPALFEKLYHTIWKNVKKQGKEKTLKNAMKINGITKKVGIDLSKVLFKDIHAIFGGRMKTMICGGAKIDPNILEGLRAFGFNALQGYGLTEAAPIGALNPQDRPKSPAIGVPLPTQDIKTINVNEEGIGEICIKGPNIMMGYFKNPEATAEVLDEEGWFHTGDLGYIDDEGYTFITGRAKNVIITKNGKNVYPEEIEYLLSLVDFIEESFVFEDAKATANDTTIVAAVKVDNEEVEELLGKIYTDEEVKDLIWKEVDKINANAPAYRQIKRVILRKKEFIHNTTSKLIRFSDENKQEG